MRSRMGTVVLDASISTRSLKLSQLKSRLKNAADSILQGNQEGSQDKGQYRDDNSKHKYVVGDP
jgi:hypothetical protein